MRRILTITAACALLVAAGCQGTRSANSSADRGTPSGGIVPGQISD
ncbi:hypothetical protein [Aurantimonas manganoxydans]|nr:hypothetical protein [Aurantimonas manganoxydans]